MQALFGVHPFRNARDRGRREGPDLRVRTTAASAGRAAAGLPDHLHVHARHRLRRRTTAWVHRRPARHGAAHRRTAGRPGPRCCRRSEPAEVRGARPTRGGSSPAHGGPMNASEARCVRRVSGRCPPGVGREPAGRACARARSSTTTGSSGSWRATPSAIASSSSACAGAEEARRARSRAGPPRSS